MTSKRMDISICVFGTTITTPFTLQIKRKLIQIIQRLIQFQTLPFKKKYVVMSLT